VRQPARGDGGRGVIWPWWAYALALAAGLVVGWLRLVVLV
jgi:hypothetical protein